MNSVENVNLKVVDGLHLIILKSEKTSKITLRQRATYQKPDSSKNEYTYWENLISYTLSVSKKGRLNSFMTKAPKKKMLGQADLLFSSEEHNRMRGLIQWISGTGDQGVKKRTVLNMTSYTSLWLIFIASYCEKKAYENSEDVTCIFRQLLVDEAYRLSNTSAPSPTIVSTSLEDMRSAVDKLFYPCAETISDLSTYVSMMSYDAREAVVLPSVALMFDKVTYKRESLLRTILNQRMSDSPNPSTHLTRSLNLMALTKTYFTDEQRIKLARSITSGFKLTESIVTRRRDTMNEEGWNMLRELCKDIKEDTHPTLFMTLWEILGKYAKHNSTEFLSRTANLYKKCYRQKMSLEEVEEKESTDSRPLSFNERFVVHRRFIGFNLEGRYELSVDSAYLSAHSFTEHYYRKLLANKSVVPVKVRKLIPELAKDKERFGHITEYIHEKHMLDLSEVMKVWAKAVGVTLNQVSARLMSEYYITLIAQTSRPLNLKPLPKTFLMWGDDINMDIRNEIVNCEETDYENMIKPFLDLTSSFRHAIIGYTKPDEIQIF